MEAVVFLTSHLAANAPLDISMMRSAKASCRDDSSTFAGCKAALQSLRDRAWVHMWDEVKNVHVGNVAMPDMILEGASEVKGFIMGGTRVTLPTCKLPGASQEDPPPALYFRHIFKSGGHSIMANMHTLGLPGLDGEVTEHWGATMWEKDHMCQELQESKHAAETSGRQGPTLFTFVRSPIERLISGYREIEFRNHFDSPHPKGSQERAAHFLQVVFRGLHNGHIVPQSEYILGMLGSVPGPLGSCPVPFDFVGKLEDFDEDWARLGARLHCPPGSFLFNRSLGEHQSSLDSDHVGGGMEGALSVFELREQDLDQRAAAKVASTMLNALHANGGALMRMICWFYLGDFALFDYDIPEECGIHMTAA